MSDLSPVKPDDVPTEIFPLVRAMNRLFERLEFGLQQERDFTDNAAHELRTPLAAIKMQVQVLLRQNSLSAHHTEQLENILASINRSSFLMEQLLEFSRLQNDSDIFTAPLLCDTSHIIIDLVRALSPFANEKKQIIQTNIQENIFLKINDQAFSILARNLIENAIKFTPPHGSVHISLTDTPVNVILVVEDTGEGIAKEHKEKVFNRFYRIKKSKATGSGLGLSMVKWIADHCHAVIELKDVPSGGLSISVIFPKENMSSD